jgi:His-Xaa-Ser system protein HxsD
MGALSKQVTFQVIAFSMDSVKRAAYKFIDKASFEFSLNESEIICNISSSIEISEALFESVIQDFRNEVLDQDLREAIARETSDIRNVILSYVFSKTSLL